MWAATAVMFAVASAGGVNAQENDGTEQSDAPPVELPGSSSQLRFGGAIPAEVATIYERGLGFLTDSQQEDGSWQSISSPGISGICLMAFLASGEDPNFGRYQHTVRKAVKSIILAQDSDTGYIMNSMYHHGFALLALSEAYGALDETRLWDGSEEEGQRRSVSEAIDLAVRAAATAQKKNQWGGWRYSPEDTEADTSVTGAVLMGLLAARNAGFEVPDTVIETALEYIRKSTAENGMVAYSGFGGMGESMNRSSIATLVFSVGKKKEWDEFGATLKYVSSNLEHREQSYPAYFRYYMAQALFQGDIEAWEKWNQETVRQLKNEQQSDGSFSGRQGPEYGTGMALLALALNYRFLPIYER
jgi:hypothetical protein